MSLDKVILCYVVLLVVLLSLKKPLSIFTFKCRTTSFQPVFLPFSKADNVLFTRIHDSHLWLCFTLEIDAHCVFTVVFFLATNSISGTIWGECEILIQEENTRRKNVCFVWFEMPLYCVPVFSLSEWQATDLNSHFPSTSPR